MENGLITVPEAARIKGVTRQAIHNALNDKRLPFVEVMEPVRMIKTEDLARFRVDRRRQSSGKQPKSIDSNQGE